MFLIFLSENLEDLEKLLFVNIDFKNDSQQKLYKNFIKDNFYKKYVVITRHKMKITDYSAVFL